MTEEYSWSVFHAASSDINPMGQALAQKFADYLEKKEHEVVKGRHRDYCGVCFVYADGKYGFGITYDGYADSIENCRVVKPNKEAFVEWLSKKSDFQLGGFDPQDDLYEASSFDRGNQRFYISDIKELVSKI